MKHSSKGDPPESFEQWKQGLHAAGVEPDYSSLQNPEKEDVICTLLSEQCHLCAYCGRRLWIQPRNCHIDHFWPQAHFDGGTRPDRRLDHDNYFMSCGPRSLPGEGPRSLPHTCGAAKDNWFDEQFHVIPSDPHCESRFLYSAAGEILPKEEDDQGAANMIEKLRLNDAKLVIERKKMLIDVEQGIGQSDESSDALSRYCDAWRLPDSQTGIADWRYGEEIAHLCGTLPSGPVPVMRPTPLQLSAAVN